METQGLRPEFLRCHGCGYSLVGAPADTEKCPECGGETDALWRARAVDQMGLVARMARERRWRVLELRVLAVVPALLAALAIVLQFRMHLLGFTIAVTGLLLIAILGGALTWGAAVATEHMALSMAPSWKHEVIRAVWWSRWGSALAIWAGSLFIGIVVFATAGIWTNGYDDGEAFLVGALGLPFVASGLWAMGVVLSMRGTLGRLVGIDLGALVALGVGYGVITLLACLQGMILIGVGAFIGGNVWG